MSSQMRPKSGDILLARLDPIKGHEQSGHRPCITVAVPTTYESSEQQFGIAIVVPLTGQEKNWWTVVSVPLQEGLRKKSYALCHQIRAISTERVTDITGTIRQKDLNKIRLVLGSVLSIS